LWQRSRKRRIKTGTWVGDCFIYTNSSNRLNYLVGGQTYTISHFDNNMYLLGYIPRDNRIYLADKDVNVFSYALSLTLIEYQTAILRGDFESAEKLLLSVPAEQCNRIARFLESQDLKEMALEVSTDVEHRFDLAIQLNKLDVAVGIAREADSELKWKTVGDVALAAWKFRLAEECLKRAKDLSGLLLIYTSSGNAKGLRELVDLALAGGKNNIAFAALFSLGDVEQSLDLLIKTERFPEAAMMARTYQPSQVSRIVKLWKDDLEKRNRKKNAESLADPTDYENLFPDIKYALIAEEQIKESRKESLSASAYPQHKHSIERDILAELKEKEVPSVAINGTTSLNGDLGEEEIASFADDEQLDDNDNMSHLTTEQVVEED